MTTTQTKTQTAVITATRPEKGEVDLMVTSSNEQFTCRTPDPDTPELLQEFLYSAVECEILQNDHSNILRSAYRNSSQATSCQEAAELRSTIRHNDNLYYQEQAPKISDIEYDYMMRRLALLEERYPELRDPHSPTQRVSGQPTAAFTNVPHPTPMLSLGNAFSKEDFEAWHQRTAKALGQNDFPMHLEVKIDGLAVRLVYIEGKLALAATRGDGLTGEDVTHTVKTVRNIPLALAAYRGDMEARGEVYMPRSVFNKLNEERVRNGQEAFANPRNAAAGGLRQLDPKAASERGLSAWMYSSPDSPQRTQGTALSGLQALGLPVNPFNAHATSKEQVGTFYQSAVENRHNWDYDADGIVIKVDDLDMQEQLGATGREPRWAIAWKFPPEQVATKLKRIEISHGRFGKLTPVAVLEPVNVGGVLVQSASLHNEQDIHKKDIREGDVILLQRAGDVIPQVTGPAHPDENRELPVFNMPAHCPACGTSVTKEQDDAAHWCLNEDCPAKLPEQVAHFVGKSAMDVDGLGSTWCDAFIAGGMVENPADIYRLTRSQLLGLPRMGEKLADRILDNIERSKEQTLQRVLYSLGIFRLGREVSSLLAERYNSLEEIESLTHSDLIAIEGIGPTIAVNVLEGLKAPRTKRTINTMREAGVAALQPPEPGREKHTHKEEPPLQQTETQLTGKTVVVTGKLEGFSRAEADQAVVRAGGNAASSVTKSTDYLVVGDKPGSKFAKANKLGVTVLNEEEFVRMLTA